MTRYLTHYARLSFLLCLLAVLCTSCNTTPDGLSLGSDNKPTRLRRASAPADMLEEQTNPQEELCKLLLSNLAYRGTDRLGLYEDRHDKATFKRQMEELIRMGLSSWEGAHYRYVAERVPILIVAVHYSTDRVLVDHLLKKSAHLGLTHEEIERCLITAAENAALMPQKKEILELLIEEFKNSSVYFQGGTTSLDNLILRCKPSGLLALIDALNEQAIDIHTVDEQGNTLLHRICQGSANPYKSLSRLELVLQELLKQGEFKKCLNKYNFQRLLPVAVLKARVAECKRDPLRLAEHKPGDRAVELLQQ